MATLREVFDEGFKKTHIDHRLADRLYRFQIGFVNKSQEHLTFFTGNLLGVQVVRFTPSDFSRFFNDVLGMDSEGLKRGIEFVEAINPSWVVVSDVFNETCFYLVHRFITSDLSERVKERAVMDLLLIFNYRVMTSLLSHYFRFPADPRVAQAVHAGLSNRYLIKKLGSWQEVLVYRSKETAGPEGLHRGPLTRYDNDLEIIAAINDSQGRIRDMVKNIYAELRRVSDRGDRISSSSNLMIDVEGEEVLKDRTEGAVNYSRRLLGVVHDPDIFIREDMIHIVHNLMPMLDVAKFKRVLDWMSDQALGTHHLKIEDYITKVIIYALNYLNDEGIVPNHGKDLGYITMKLKGGFLSSRSSDPELYDIRDHGDALVKLALDRVNTQTMGVLRNSMVLYLCLRAFTLEIARR